jgi:hypothetical protein
MFNFKNLFKPKVRQPLPVGHIIETPPEIRCIANQILNDLDIKNADKWVFELKDCSQYCTCQGKSYTLYWSGHYMNLQGMSTFQFNRDEREALYIKLSAIQEFKNKQIRNQLLKVDEEVLKKLFPDCYQ